MRSSAALGKEEDIAAGQQPYVVLIGCKHTKNPSGSGRPASCCSPDVWMQAYGSNVKYLFVL